jgi:hypothetical protein
MSRRAKKGGPKAAPSPAHLETRAAGGCDGFLSPAEGVATPQLYHNGLQRYRCQRFSYPEARTSMLERPRPPFSCDRAQATVSEADGGAWRYSAHEFGAINLIARERVFRGVRGSIFCLIWVDMVELHARPPTAAPLFRGPDIVPARRAAVEQANARLIVDVRSTSRSLAVQQLEPVAANGGCESGSCRKRYGS